MTYTPEGEKYSAWVKNDAFSMRRSVGIKNSTIIILEIPRRGENIAFLKKTGETKCRIQGTTQMYTKRILDNTETLVTDTVLHTEVYSS